MRLQPSTWLSILSFLLFILIAQKIHGLSYSPSIRSVRSRGEAASTILRSEATSHQPDIPSWNEGGKVTVRVVKELSPGCTPSDVLEAWMEHHWRRGGGLPILVSTASDSSLETEMKRTIYPVAMKERILSSERNGAPTEPESISLRYEVSEAGPFFADLVPGSHQGTVTFTSEEMIWEVQFETTQLRPLYQTVTEFTVGIASRTVQEACGPTRLLTLNAKIPRRRQTASLIDLRRELLEFFWARGGGLPLLPPIPFGDVLQESGGRARSKLLRIPPVIVESIVSTSSYNGDGEGNIADIVYRLEDPGWLTFPFLLHTHLGQIQLISASKDDDDSCLLKWQVEIRPYLFASLVVEKLVEMTIATIVRNFLVHIQEPGATTPLRLPGDGTPEFLRSISIPKASWWGGVMEKLDANDMTQGFSGLDKLLSVLTPWDWGRTGTGNDDDILSYSWMDGEKIKLQ